MDRRHRILKAIIESFIASAEPIGSKYLLNQYNLGVSPATVRNEMAALEKAGLIYQPYTSAGRIPTSQGFRLYVDDLMGTLPADALEQKQLGLSSIKQKKIEDRLYQAVGLLARTCANVCFATLPHLHKAYYLGLSNILQTPEFEKSIEAYTVVKVLEDTDRFIDLLEQLPIDRSIKVFIGEENIIKEIQSCSIIATSFELEGLGKGVIGILGPTRMNYAFNMGALESLREDIEG